MMLLIVHSDNVEVKYTHGNPRIEFFNDLGEQVGTLNLNEDLHTDRSI